MLQEAHLDHKIQLNFDDKNIEDESFDEDEDEEAPASVGDVLILFAEGYGAATAATALPDGTIVTSKLPVPAAAVTVLIDGQPLSSGNILYLGGAPDLINGVLQVNFTVPQLAPGSHQIQLQVGSPARTSPTAVTLATK